MKGVKILLVIRYEFLKEIILFRKICQVQDHDKNTESVRNKIVLNDGSSPAAIGL